MKTILYAFCISTVVTAAPSFTYADSNFRRRVDESFARAAQRNYLAIYRQHPTNEDAAWRLAMANQFVGMRFERNSEEKKQFFAQGRDVARECVNNNPSSVPCHFWFAINSALYGETVGAIQMLSSLSTILSHLRTVTELDASYAFGGSDRVMGLIFQKLPGILGGSNSRAKEHLERAIEASPNEPMNYLFLARLLAGEFNEKEQALKMAQRGLLTPAPPVERVESNEAISELRALVVSLKSL